MKLRAIILTILASVAFFNPHAAVSPQMQKTLFYLCVLLCFGVGITSGTKLDNVKFPRGPFLVLIGSIGFSTIMATAFHMQSFKVSVVTTLPYIFAYGMFYALMRLDVSRDKIMKAYLILGGISTLVYFANVATVPNNVFGSPIIDADMTRGIIRIPVVFIEFFPMIIFYAINKWFDTRKRFWIIIISIAGLMVILSVIRQIILLTALLGIFFLLRKVSWKIKVLTGAAIVGIVVYVLPMIPMYKTMLEFSEKQKEENDDEENIRITAWRFYTYENQTNAMTPFFGNGVPAFGNSRWGIQFESETDENLCFAGDVGWAGFYWYFGIFATLSLLYMMIKGIIKKKKPENQYITYYLIFLVLTSFASGPPLYFWQILDISMALYFVYKKDDDDSLSTNTDEQDCPNNIKLQQLPRHPQLR